MSRYNVYCYEVTPNSINTKAFNEELVKGILTKTIDDTSKLTFSLLASVVGKDELLPMKTLVRVTRGIKELFFGTLVKRSYSILDGVFSYECVGVLGSYQFMPPYRSFAAGTDLDVVIAQTEARFNGTATGVYACANPWTELYSGKSELTNFGSLSTTYFGCAMNAGFTDIQKNAENAYDFLKSIAEQGAYYLPNSWDWAHWVEDGRSALLTPISGVNTQEVRYDRNLISCDIELNPYVTRAKVVGKGANVEKAGADYPGVFYFKDYYMEDKASGNYTQSELTRYADNFLSDQEVIINATGFDEGILDNGTPFLDMDKFVNLVYLENNTEVRVQTTISQITYNLTNPSQDKVQLGKRIKPLTER